MYNYRGSREQLNRVSIPFENLFSLYRRISPTVTVPPFSSPLFAIARCANCLPTNHPETNVRVNVISSKLGAEGIGNYDARARELERERERIEDVYWIRLRSAMNQAANSNFPPNKSIVLYIYIYIYIKRYSFIVGWFGVQEREHCFVCDRRTDYSGTIERG